MTSRLIRGYDFSRKETIYEIRISDLDLIDVYLNRADRHIINNENPSKTPIADILLRLELIVRRIEESKDNEQKRL